MGFTGFSSVLSVLFLSSISQMMPPKKHKIPTTVKIIPAVLPMVSEQKSVISMVALFAKCIAMQGSIEPLFIASRVNAIPQMNW